MKIDEMDCLNSHESLPVIVIGTNIGKVYVLSILDPKTPAILHEFYLCSHEITSVKFLPTGSDMVVNSSIGDFFIITVSQFCSMCIDVYIL